MRIQKAYESYDPREGRTRSFKDERGVTMREAAAFPLAPLPADLPWPINGWIPLLAISGAWSSADYVRDVSLRNTVKIYPYMTGWFADGIEYALFIQPIGTLYTIGMNRSLDRRKFDDNESIESLVADGWSHAATRSSRQYDIHQCRWDGIPVGPVYNIQRDQADETHSFFQRASR